MTVASIERPPVDHDVRTNTGNDDLHVFFASVVEKNPGLSAWGCVLFYCTSSQSYGQFVPKISSVFEAALIGFEEVLRLGLKKVEGVYERPVHIYTESKYLYNMFVEGKDGKYSAEKARITELMEGREFVWNLVGTEVPGVSMAKARAEKALDVGLRLVMRSGS